MLCILRACCRPWWCVSAQACHSGNICYPIRQAQEVVEVAVSDLPHRRLVLRRRHGVYVRGDVVQDEAVVAAGWLSTRDLI